MKFHLLDTFSALGGKGSASYTYDGGYGGWSMCGGGGSRGAPPPHHGSSGGGCYIGSIDPEPAVSVMRHATMQGFTTQICLLMSLLRNYRSYWEESTRYNSIYIASFCAIVIVCFTRLSFYLMVCIFIIL